MKQWWYGFDRTSTYFIFIESCRKKKYDMNKELNVHHIIPKHWFDNGNLEELGYCESIENKIILSVEDHIKAHELLYEAYRRPQDRGAVLLLQGDKIESRKLWRRLGAEKVHEILQEEKKIFWDPEFQKEMAQRSLAREDALEIRSKGGKKGGKTTNKGKAIKLEDRYLFYFEKQPVFCVFNCETGGEVLEILHSYKQTSLKRATQLLNRTRKTLNGWSCEKLLEE